VGIVLHYLHNHYLQVAHCDIHLNNVLIDNNLSAFLADYGLALTTRTQSPVTTPRGKAIQTAPEVLARQAYTTQSDVYSFGRLMLTVMTSKTADFPFITEDNVDLLKEVLESLERENSQVYQLIIKCLKNKSTDRPMMDEVLNELDHCIALLTGEPAKLPLWELCQRGLLVGNEQHIQPQPLEAAEALALSLQMGHISTAQILLPTLKQASHQQFLGRAIIQGLFTKYSNIYQFLSTSYAALLPKETLFVLACGTGHLDVVQHLVQQDPKIVNKIDGFIKKAGLHLACAHNFVSVVEFLLNHGADPTLLDQNNWNAFHYAALKESDQLLELLLQFSDLDASALNVNEIVCDRTPLHFAAISEQKNAYHMLRIAGATEFQDKWGFTPQRYFDLKKPRKDLTEYSAPQSYLLVFEANAGASRHV